MESEKQQEVISGNMSKRSSWCEFNKKTREYIKEREKNRCIVCGTNYNLTIAHIFVSRAHGGKGCKENGILLCKNCHYFILDNPIGKIENEKAKIYLEFCKNYLKNTEKIVINKNFIDSLIFSKSS